MLLIQPQNRREDNMNMITTVIRQAPKFAITFIILTPNISSGVQETKINNIKKEFNFGRQSAVSNLNSYIVNKNLNISNSYSGLLPAHMVDLTNEQLDNYRKVADEFYGQGGESLFDLSDYLS